MRKAIPWGLWVALAVLAAGSAAAQSSTSYHISDSHLNAAGHPEQGTTFSSASYRVSLDALGDGTIGVSLTSASFHADAGFVGAYPPPGEIHGLSFTDPTTLSWGGERSSVLFDLYRDDVGTLPGNYGSCLLADISGTSATDTASPAAGTAWYYLVTGKNRLGEEGTKGSDSNGAERPNPSPCP